MTERIHRLATSDAQAYWMAAKIPSDQFLLYAFDGVPADPVGLCDQLRRRAEACPDLRLRIVDNGRWRAPRWRSGPVTVDQLAVHNGPRDWADCLDDVAALADHQLDPRRAAWRLHLYPAVTGVPDAVGPASVAVVQICHALADGQRTAAQAAWLFGRDEPVPEVAPLRRGNLVWRGIVAARTQRALDDEIAAGRIPSPPSPRPLLPTNTEPAGPRRIRTLIRSRAELAGSSTVTVAALAGIGAALDEHLRARGAELVRLGAEVAEHLRYPDPEPVRLGAEVPMALAGTRHARNHFRNVGIDLHPELPWEQRTARIAEQLAGARQRAAHPAAHASARSLAAVPSALVRLGVRQFDPTVRAPLVTGNTVVSSVNRGAADLVLGSAPVLFTAGYPGLSPMIGLTHGVHGIGDTVAISVHAADSVMTVAQLDDYVARLDQALSRPR